MIDIPEVVFNTAKVYVDAEGNDRTIRQMVKYEPEWAATRLQVGELYQESWDKLRGMIEKSLDAELNKSTMKVLYLIKSHMDILQPRYK